jgi:predicted nucleotidyltransferase
LRQLRRKAHDTMVVLVICGCASCCTGNHSYSLCCGQEMKLILKVLAGSRAYGTHLPESDYDYVSIVIPPASDILGMEYQETTFSSTDEEDNTIHTFQKFIKLAAGNNPNILDILFSPRHLWVEFDVLWLQLYGRRHLFLSKKVAESYFGYARAQLKRMQTHKGWLMKPPTNKPSRADFDLPGHSTIPKEHREAIISLPQKFIAEGIQEAARREKEYAHAMKEWHHYENWKKNRNPERAALEARFGYDTKHAMHLFRLLIQAKELLKHCDLAVDRTGIDADLLKSIRFRGAYSYDQLMGETEKLKEEIEELRKSTKLPEEPNMAQINQLCVNILKQHIKSQ